MSGTRCFVIASAIIFALMFVAHALRIYVEGSGILRAPIIIVTTVLSFGMMGWALYLLFRRPR